ncbi:MAG: transcription antitermination factor NusB [Cardiobacteriaceae bacterium]|nr:transcription antitermination factor NusB [Cardiobacteriaceae bacterium]
MKTPNLKRQAIEARARARRELMQLLYQWQITGDSAANTLARRFQHHPDLDEDYFAAAWHGITANPQALEEKYQPYMSRKAERLDPVERAILWVGAWELANRPDIHPTVTLNEAIEMAKQFGADDSYKFINGTLDKLAKSIK